MKTVPAQPGIATAILALNRTIAARIEYLSQELALEQALENKEVENNDFEHV